MIDGVELLQLRQRRSADGKTFFTGKINGAAVVMVRDDFEDDLWKVIVGDPFRAEARRTSPARAIAAAPADQGDDDEGNHDEGDMDDDISDELIASLSPSEGR